MSLILYCHSREEIDDLGSWATHHPDDETLAEHVPGEDPNEVRKACDDWLAGVWQQYPEDKYPMRITVPETLEVVLDFVIEDWAESCAFLNEPFESHLEDAISGNRV